MTRKYDLYTQEFHRRSHEVFAQMRQDDPVFQQQGITGDYPIWFVTRYTEVEQVLLNDRVFVRDPLLVVPPEQANEIIDTGNAQVNAMVNNHMLNKEGEDHRRLRSLVSKAFNPRVIQELRPRIQQIADSLIDGVEKRGTMDLVTEFAYPLPITVIAEMLGIPVADRPRFRAWSNAFVKPPLTPEEIQESMRLMGEMAVYMLQMVAARRKEPGDDLLSGLIHAEEQGDRLNESELFSMLALLIVAGHETTVTFIGNAVLALLQNPEEREALMRNPGLMPAAVEELLRYDSPVERALTRWVAQDVELAGKSLKRGDLIIAVPASANRDETHFDNPTELRFDRKTNAHIAFGKGVHYCLGSPLARLEGEIALNTLFRRLPGLTLDCAPDELKWREVPLFHSLESLPVRWQTTYA